MDKKFDETVSDFPGKKDLYVATSAYPRLWEALHISDTSFSSIRYSRHKEAFCFVKMDGRNGMEETPWKDRGEIEDAIEEGVSSKGLGCQIGAGTGFFYSYIDFAVTDLNAAVAEIRRILSEGKINKRTWILFFGEELSKEWVGVYPDTPLPPGFEECR